MQLDLAADRFEQAPDLGREAVDTARQMSRHSMLDARRSVWDLRCHLLEQGDLVSAMTQTLRPLAPQERSRKDWETRKLPLLSASPRSR
jgi:signal transduction histidine kinase